MRALLRYVRFPCLLATLAAALPPRTATAQTYTLAAPGAPVEVVVTAGAQVTLEVRFEGEPVVHPSAVGLDVEGVLDPDAFPGVTAAQRRAVDEVVRPVVPEKRAEIPDRFNELRLAFGPALALTVRAYDDGVAYRFETAFADSLTVRHERVGLRFAAGDSAYVPGVTCRQDVDCFHTSFEENYVYGPLDSLIGGPPRFLPVLVKTHGTYVLVTESDLWDYPGLWVRGAAEAPGLEGTFAAYPLEERVVGDAFKQRVVARRAGYIARTAGTRTFPWRVLMLARHETALVANDLVYRLARPLALDDASWVRPGKSTEEWITSRLLHGVDFASGLNTETYRYYVDFAADVGLEYVMFDAGWSDNDDLTRLTPEIDLPALIAYAHERGVRVLLWNLALAFERQMEAALDRYERWGVAGVMVDFMDRDDQPTLRFYERVVREAAKRRLLVNFHGAFKPTGMQRAYPNQITREAVLGHEFNMWSDRVTPGHLLTIPFVRMPAGPLDYEGGAMNNGTRNDFRVVFERPMNQGTRTQQLALYVVYESPLQYLAATASDYRAEPAFTRFLAAIPTTWDETRVLDGRIGDYLVLARRKGRDWYVAAVTDWTPRRLALPLAFLPDGTYDAVVVSDGANADRYARDYRMRTETVEAAGTLTLDLAPGGGWVARLRAR